MAHNWMVCACAWCRRVDTSEAHAERAVLREQLDRAYDTLQLKRTEERNTVQDVAQVSYHTPYLAAVAQQMHQLPPFSHVFVTRFSH